MRSRRRRPGACGILVRVVVAWWAAIVAGGPGARAGDGPEDTTRLLVETIDRLIAAGWAEHRVEPAAPADDAEFLRRVSLDLAGRIPSAGEAHEFLEDPSPEKRRRLVDRLLAGPAYVAHFTTIERRLMIPEADTNRQLRLVAPAFEAWLRRQVAGNVGYDQVVRELLTVPVVPDRSRQPTPVVPGLGRVQEPSPLPFYLAKEVKGENLAASTARLFLGLRLDAPSATTTRSPRGPVNNSGAMRRSSPASSRRAPPRPWRWPAGSGKFPTATRRRSPVPARSCRRPSSTALFRPGGPRSRRARSWPSGWFPPRTPSSPARRSTACGPTSSASAWSTRSTTWGRTTHRVTPSFSTPWRVASWTMVSTGSS